MLEKIKGTIIKTQDYQETNKIITIFSSKIGKFSAIARGAKKPKGKMAAITQPFIYGEFYIYVNPGLSTLQQGDIIDSFRPIREDIFKTAYAAYIAELTDKILDFQTPDAYIYDQFYRTMNWISENDEVEIPVMMYELKLFAKGGFAPIVSHCIQCGNKDTTYYFSVNEGGVLCLQCYHIDQNSIALPASISKLLHLFMDVGIERIGSISMKPENKNLLRQILDAYYDQYGGYYLKTKRFLKQIDLLK